VSKVAENKYSLDLSQATIFCIVFVVMAVLVGLGKVEARNLADILLILIPSPINKAPVLPPKESQ
jgi:hypothetical protein